jgi:hypothetical protein
MSSDERPGFLSSGLRCASLKMSGKVPSDNDKLTKSVIGAASTSTHDLSKHVGMQSRRQVESEDFRMISVTS